MTCEMDHAFRLGAGSPTVCFIGVTTGRSSIGTIFPLWMRELGRPDIVLQGVDLRPHADSRVYRGVLAQIKADPLLLGAVVTSHKVDLYAAAEDMFDDVGPYARACREVSCIAKPEGRLEGHATDPVASGLTLDALLGKGYFARTRGHVLILGAGGAGVAVLLHLAAARAPEDRPEKIILVDRIAGRLAQARETLSAIGATPVVDAVCHEDPAANDRLLAALPDHSLVINATGLGKDAPGSPVTWAGLFPRGGVAWDFNYRGDLQFVRQAESQAAARNVTVEDGWRYFVHGWTQALARVLQIELTPQLFARLEQIAGSGRRSVGSQERI